MTKLPPLYVHESGIGNLHGIRYEEDSYFRTWLRDNQFRFRVSQPLLPYPGQLTRPLPLSRITRKPSGKSGSLVGLALGCSCNLKTSQILQYCHWAKSTEHGKEPLHSTWWLFTIDAWFQVQTYLRFKEVDHHRQRPVGRSLSSSTSKSSPRKPNAIQFVNEPKKSSLSTF
jgi:hypothetical protein